MRNLNVHEMENVEAGGDVLTNRSSCEALASVAGGASIITGTVGSALPPVLIVSALVGAFSWGLSQHCSTLY